MNITLNTNELLAVALFTKRENFSNITDLTTEQMKGVNVDIKNNIITLIATDRENLVLLEVGKTTGLNDVNFTIPLKVLKDIKKSNSRNCKTHGVINVRYKSLVFCEGHDIIVTQNEREFTTPELKGVFPDWRQVVPKPFIPSFGTYPLEVMSLFFKAKMLLNGRSFNFYHNGEDVGVVHIKWQNPDNSQIFVGLVSPSTRKIKQELFNPMEVQND